MRATSILIIVIMALAAFSGQLEFLSSVNLSAVTGSEVLEEASFAGEVVFNDDYIHVAFGQGGLVTLNISDPESPRAVSRENIGNITELIKDENVLYALNSDGSVVVLDVTEATTPHVVTEVALDSDHLVGFEINESIDGNTYLYTMKYANSIVTLNISDSASPVISGETSLRGREAVAMNQIADFLVVYSDDALVFFDNYYFPNAPRWYNTADRDGDLNDMAVKDNIGIVGSSVGANILAVNDYGDIISEISTFDGVENTSAVGFWDNFAVIASDDNINVFDVHQLDGDVLVDSRSVSHVNEIALDEESGVMIVSKGYSGLEILDASSIFSRNVELRTGWNTVSLPVVPDDGFELTSDVAAYKYDAVEGRYVEETELQPGVGYFYFSTSDSRVDFDGEAIESSVRSLVPGWNLVATGSHYVNISDIATSGLIEPVLYYYNAESQNYEIETTILSPDKSYWILSLDYVTVDLDNGTTSFGRRVGNGYSRNDFSTEPPTAPGIVNDDVAVEEDNTVLIGSVVTPFSSKTSVTFEVTDAQNVTARVYDMNGRVVTTLDDSQMSEGTHQVTWQPESNVPSGVYMVSINTDKGFDSKKIVLAR